MRRRSRGGGVEQGRALGRGRAGRVAEHPVRADRAHAAGPQRRHQLGQRRRCCRPPRTGRTRAGSSASCTEVSVRPACASPSQRGDQARTSRPSDRSSRTAAVTGSGVAAVRGQQQHPPHRRRQRGPAELDQQQLGRRRADRERAGEAGVLPAGPVRARPARPARRRRPAASRDASATATSVSVDSGRCGPCCSVEPTGTTSSRPADLRPRSASRGRPAGQSAPSRRTKPARDDQVLAGEVLERRVAEPEQRRSRSRRAGCRARSPPRPARWRPAPTGTRGRSSPRGRPARPP